MRAGKWAACVAAMLHAAAHAQSTITLSVGAAAGESVVPEDYLGLSFESSNLLPQPDGGHLFGPANRRLVDLFRMLGIRSLRIGGATADMPRYAIPSEKDIDSLFAFAQAAGVQVLYTLRLPRSDAARNAAIASYIQRRYGSQLTCFEIGNEPDFYRRIYREFPTYAEYRAAWKEIAAAVTAVAPTARFCGPAAGETTSWSRNFAQDFAATGRVAALVQHEYPGGNGAWFSGAIARDQLLSRAWLENYDRLYQSFATAAILRGLPYRLEETNNFTGGAKDASDTFAAALWALDYLHWWAAHGAAGINFHNRRWILNTTIYPVNTDDDGLKSGYEIHPIAYGIKAFDVGGHGRTAPVSITGNPDALNMTAYAVQQRDTIFVTVINKKDFGDRPVDAKVSITLPAQCKTAATMFLVPESGALDAKTGITLGGAQIFSNAWEGKWIPVPLSGAARCAVNLPGGAAVVVRFSMVPPFR